MQLEATTLADPRVRSILERFEMIRVDTDETPDAGVYFEIFGLPTLVVVDPEGNERFRHLGMIDAETLAAELAALVFDDGAPVDGAAAPTGDPP